MSSADSERLLQHIRRIAGDDQTTLCDAELLRRYRESRDQAAFAELLRRHGAMVFAVCQSVLRQRQDSEDAFQAVFVILARQAGSIGQPEALGGWLQRVAYRVAWRARAGILRRRANEAKAARSLAEEPSCDDLSWGELRAVLHEELATLPDRFRGAMVLCYLEGLKQEDAARRLGCTAATVKGRLQRGREKLRLRLERRGVALTAALGAALTGQALAGTAGCSSGLPALASAAAVELACGFLRPLLPIKLAMLSAVLVSVGVLASGIALRSPPSEPRPSGSGESNRSLTVAAQKEAELRPVVDAHGDPLPSGAVARLGTVRFNHGDGLHSLFFSPDGKTLISEGNGSIRFWDAGNGKELDRVNTGKVYHEFPITILADGKTLISLSEGIDNRDVAVFWDLAAKKRVRTKELPVRRSVFFTEIRDSLSPDGKLCVMHVHTPPHIQVSDVTTGKSLYQLAQGAKNFNAVAFVDNDHLASGNDKNHLEIWEARTGKLLHRFPHDAAIRYLLASPDGRWLASLEQPPSPYGRNVEQETVYLWDTSTGKVKQTFRAKPKHWFTNVCFSPESKTLLTSSRHAGEQDEVILWDRATGRRLLTFDAASGINADITTFSPDGSRLAAGNNAGKFELWDLKNGHRLTSEDSRHIQRFAAVVLDPTGERATVSGKESLSVWDATSGKRLRSMDLPGGTFIARCLSPDGRYAVTYRGEGEGFLFLIWDIAARKCLHTLRFPGGYQQITSAFSPDSFLLAAWRPGEPTRVHLWDVRSGKQVRSFEETKTKWPGQMHFTDDGKTLFVAGVRIAAYEVASGKELFCWRLDPLPNTSGARTGVTGVKPESEEEQLGWRALAVSPDGTRAAAILWDVGFSHQRLENRLALYDGHSGKCLRRWNDSGVDSWQLEHMAFSHDGQLLASSDGHAVHIWETATSKLIQTFKGHQGVVESLAFSSDDRRLASTSRDSTILIWDTTGQPDKAAALTEAKWSGCWNDLAGEDAGRAQRAVWTMIRSPREAVAFLKTRLHPVKPVRREQIDRWIQDLDAGNFDVRQQASAELEKLGELAEPALRRALENKPTLEQRRRIEPMLAKLEAAIPAGETLRSLRAVRVLEHAATAEARRLLRELANGAAAASLTREAGAALNRLNRRGP